MAANQMTEQDSFALRLRVGAPSAAIYFWIAFALILPGLIYTSRGEHIFEFYTLKLLLIGLGSTTGLAFVIALGRPHYLRISFYIFCYVFIFLAGTIQITADTFPLDGRTYTPPVLQQTTTVLLVGFVAHELGYFIAPKFETFRSHTSRSSWLLRPVTSRATWVVVLAVGVVASLLAIASSGLAPYFNSRDAVGALAFGDTGRAYGSSDKGLGIITNKITHVPVFISLYLILWSRRRAHRQSLRSTTSSNKTVLQDSAVFLILVALNLVMNNPIGNSRLWAGVVLFSIISLYVDLKRARTVAIMAVSLMALYVVVFPIADSFRRSDSLGLVAQAPVDSLRGDGSFSAFQTTANGVEYLASHDHTNGQQILGGIFTLVPRAWWSSKPLDTGSLIDVRFNRASTIWTEGQVDFGMVGVVVVLFLLGAVVSRIDSSFASSGHDSFSHLIVPILAPFYVFLLRGSLSAAVGVIVPVLVCLIICYRFQDARRDWKPQSFLRRNGDHAVHTALVTEKT